MAAPVNLLTAKGSKWKLDPDSLKAFFNYADIEKRPGAKKLMREISDRIHAGIDRNVRDYRLFKAMDWAYDTPFYQVSYTQLRHLLDKQPDDKAVMDAVNSWGLTHLLPDVTNSDGSCCTNADGSKKKAVNLPVFFNVFVPICMAYITVRWAKLFNDRNQYPHFKYEPAQFTIEDRLRCEVITQIVQKMSSWFDYPSDTRQTILQTLMYGVCINFPKEAWYCEKQLGEDAKEKTVREGIRFEMPHPSRMYTDPYYRLSTLNSNSGCEFAGHWQVSRYRDIRDNPHYWNRDRVSLGSGGWFASYGDFFEQVAPCVMKWPNPPANESMDRQTQIEHFYDHQGDADAATLETTHFQRIIPKDYGMGDYPYPLWFRFVVTSDEPIVWAEPVAYDVLPTYGYDADFNRARFRSLTLEIMPFQDHISNLLSHWILAVKQNLMNPIFVDLDKVSKEDLSRLNNMGAKQMAGNIYVGFSGAENRKFQTDQKDAFHQPVFARHNTAEMSQIISGVIGILDRVMQLSPQEIGQAASHEQTAEESRIIATNTSTRVTFTGSFIDSGDIAKKRMIYDGLMAYADDDIIVGIDSSFADSEEQLEEAAKKVGIEFVDKNKAEDGPGKSPRNPKNSRMVKVKKSKLQLEQFASTRPETDRINNAAIAEAMSKIYIALAGNQQLLMAVGTQQTIEFLNQIATVAGLPKEFKLRGKDVDLTQPPEEQAKQLQTLLSGFADQVKQLVDQKQQETMQASAQQTQAMVTQAMEAVAQQLQPLVQTVTEAAQVNQTQQQQIDRLAMSVAQIGQVVQQIVQPPPPPPAVSSVMPGMEIPPMEGPMMSPEMEMAPGAGAPGVPV